jgi:hypothetical protein
MESGMTDGVTRKTAWQAALDDASEHLLTLKARSVAELMAMPSFSGTTMIFGGRDVRRSVYKEVIDDGSIKVVVQLMMPARWPFGMLGISTVFADGFRAGRDGDSTMLAPEELYDFM